jgi:tetrahydromethanopterin S-methyltransferase subunit F
MIIFNLIIKDGPIFITIISTIFGGIVAGVLFAAIMQYTAKKLFKKDNR